MTGLNGRRLARFGEDVACSFLARRGARILERNLLVGGGEIDILARHGDATLAVEVKTVGFGADAADPVVRLTPQKALQVRSLAAQLRGHGPLRVDFVGVRLGPEGVTVNWRPGIA